MTDIRLEAKRRLLLTAKETDLSFYKESGPAFSCTGGRKLHALAFNKLPFDSYPPEDFKEKFLKKFSGKEAVNKLWIYRRALRSYMDQPQYKKWCSLLDDTEKEISK